MNTIVFNPNESTSRTQTHTFTIDDLVSVESVSVNTGSVSVVSVVDDLVTLNCLNGSYTRQVLAGGSYTPADSIYVTAQTSSYYNSGGYSGSLSSYLYSGSYTSSDSKIESLNKQFWAASRWEWNGTTWDKVEGGAMVVDDSLPYDSDGYSGILFKDSFVSSEGSIVLVANGPDYDGTTIGQSVMYTANSIWKYQGTVIKPAIDTRVYRYQGTVTKPASDTRYYTYYYQYVITITVKTFPQFSMKLDNEIKTSVDGWVKIGGELKQISTITIKDNGVLKEV